MVRASRPPPGGGTCRPTCVTSGFSPHPPFGHPLPALARGERDHWLELRTENRELWNYATALVHARQRLAATGIISWHSGQFFIGASGAGFSSARMIRKMTNAMITKSRTVPRK